MIRKILDDVRKGRMNSEEAERALRMSGVSCVGDFAKLDTGRAARSGVPEIVLAEGKTPQQVVNIARRLKNGIISRLEPAHITALKKAKIKMKLNLLAKVAVMNPQKKRAEGVVGVMTAGTSDIPVAEEAASVAEAMGFKVLREYDVGVAGIHRLLPSLKKMIGAEVIVVAAGREGTLPSIVAGLVSVPVIGVPTSQGYGFGGKGEAALKSMLQSCAFITVVNIDNGVGAGACASIIAGAGRRG